MPATVLVTTGYVDTSREFWWDQLERLVFLSKVFPSKITISTPKGETVWSAKADMSRADIYNQLHACLKPVAPDSQLQALEEIETLVIDAPRPRETHRPLKRKELVRLSGSPWITIGAHTVHHVALAMRPPDEQQWEILQSLQDLGEWIKKPVTVFSYPYGGGGDIGMIAPTLVNKAGCTLGRANAPGLVLSRSNRFKLPGLLSYG